jgi:glycolate dehydrogenase FAD-binding subunit
MSQVAVSFASRLADFVGAGRLLTDAGSLAAYEVDGRGPAAALQPDSVAEIAEILRFASAERLAVIPTGGRTHLHIGLPPQRYDLTLDLSRMNHVLAYEPRDLTLGVEPGVAYAELQRILREKGQFLPLAPPFPERATLGGIVATNTDSPFRYAHGTAKDFLLGLEFVTGEGIISKSGGRVVKNVTGYDLHKLFIGSLGTLGVITRLNFRTFPLPRGQKMFVAVFTDQKDAFALCRATMKSPLQPRILDVLDPGAVGLVVPRGADFVARDSWLVIVEAAGPEAVLERHARDLGSMAQQALAKEFVSLSEAQRDQLFARLCEFSPLAVAASSEAIIFRVAVLPSAMPPLLDEVRKRAERNGLNYAILIRALGVVYIGLLPTGDAKMFSELLSCARELIELCIASGTAPMIERCPTHTKEALGVWPLPGNEHEIAQRLKHVFDPQGILSPGRFRGAI